MSKLIITRRSLIKAGLASAAALPLGGCEAFDFLEGTRQRHARIHDQDEFTDISCPAFATFWKSTRT